MNCKNNNNHPLLIIGPDSSVENTFSLAKSAYPHRDIEKIIIPTRDYYYFDFSELKNFPSDKYSVCTSTNEFYLNDVRRDFYEKISSMGFSEESIISPLAHIHEEAILEEGCIVHSGCTIDAGVKIGKKTLLRPNVSIGDNCTIGDFVTLESNVSLRELVSIGSHTLISANISVARMIKIGDYCYLNKQKQYIESIADYTSISSIFPNPVRAYF